MARITLTDDDVAILCEAIVHRAVVDYCSARKYFRDLNRHMIPRVATEVYEQEKLLHDAERFLTSQWFYMMGGEPSWFRMLKRRCDRGYFRKEEK